MRAEMIFQNNWLHSKLSFIQNVDLNEIGKMEFCSETELSKYKPKMTVIKEIPFNKNNPRAADADKVMQPEESQ